MKQDVDKIMGLFASVILWISFS